MKKFILFTALFVAGFAITLDEQERLVKKFERDLTLQMKGVESAILTKPVLDFLLGRPSKTATDELAGTLQQLQQQGMESDLGSPDARDVHNAINDIIAKKVYEYRVELALNMDDTDTDELLESFEVNEDNPDSSGTDCQSVCYAKEKEGTLFHSECVNDCVQQCRLARIIEDDKYNLADCPKDMLPTPLCVKNYATELNWQEPRKICEKISSSRLQFYECYKAEFEKQCLKKKVEDPYCDTESCDSKHQWEQNKPLCKTRCSTCTNLIGTMKSFRKCDCKRFAARKAADYAYRSNKAVYTPLCS